MYKTPTEHTKQRNLYLNEDLPIEAVFTSKHKSMQIFLQIVLDHVGEDRRVNRDTDSGYRVRFKDGMYRTNSKAVVLALMAHPARKRGKIFPDPKDPNGFWRKTCGAELKVETREVLEIKNVGTVMAKDLKFGNLKGVDPEAVVPPLVVVTSEDLGPAPEKEPVV